CRNPCGSRSCPRPGTKRTWPGPRRPCWATTSSRSTSRAGTCGWWPTTWSTRATRPGSGSPPPSRTWTRAGCCWPTAAST
ncbi:MAG: hypothetical protein AVDCRST_MAG10-2925, partial [uncultured Acidimicrobiales bacterium]